MELIYDAIFVLSCLLALLLIFRKPSNSRVWSKDQAVLPYSEFVNDDKILLHNVRNIAYRTAADFDVKYYDARYELSELTRVWFMVAPFGPPGVAHTFLLFGFKDGKTLALSIEIRKKEGQHFQPLMALLPRFYEIMYVWADEHDVVRLRTDIWKYKTYKLPLAIKPEPLKKLFIGALKRTNRMKDKPEFYNVWINNCTNNLIGHMREAGVKLPRFSWRYVFPSAIERILQKRDLILKALEK